MENENITLLIVQLQQGSEEAFTRIYDKFSKPLYGNILRLVREEEVAEELLQDLFLKVWERREGINAEQSFKSFLYKVAENLVYSHFRKVAKDRRMTERLIAAYVDHDSNAEDQIIKNENHELIRGAIEHLTPQRRQVYKLCKLEGKSYQEVSDELGITTNTVRNHVVASNKIVKDFFITRQDLAVIFIATQVFNHIK